jgi:hypothetical protein
LAGAGYAVYAKACGGGSLASPADSGDFCLALNSTTACQQPITLSPPALIFSPQTMNSPPTLQTITLANTFGSVLGGLTLTLTNNGGADSFTETDTCGLQGVPSAGIPFTLNSKQSCIVTISFSPQAGCAAGTPPDQCLAATLTVTSPNNSAIFTVPITGGISAAAASNREVGVRTEASHLPLLKFNQSVPRENALSSSHARQGSEHHAEID